MKAIHNNSLTALPGILVGHYTDDRRPTGCTVVLCPKGAVAGVDVRGAAPGTRDTDALSPANTVQEVHGVVLTGGSAYGLDAAGGVMRWLEERGHGLQVGPAIVPIVPAAVIFDLWVDDFSNGQIKKANKGEGLGNQFLTHIRETQAIVVVLRVFENPDIIHVENSVDPLRDLEIINTELILKDLETIEKRLVKAEGEARSGKKEAVQDRDELLRVKKLY